MPKTPEQLEEYKKEFEREQAERQNRKWQRNQHSKSCRERDPEQDERPAKAD